MDEYQRKYPPMRCRVCLRPLDAYEERGQVAWCHGAVDRERQDHEPDPEPVEDPNDTFARCDFCLVDLGYRAGWVIPTRSFTVRGFREDGQDYNSVGHWAACDDCMSDFRRSAWNLIAARHLARATERSGRVFSRAEARGWAKRIRQLWSRAKLNQIGEEYNLLAQTVDGETHRA